MTNMLQPLVAAEMMDRADRADGADSSVTEVGSFQDGELTSLIRRWMAAGGKMQERVRRDSMLRLAPAPVEVDEVDEVDEVGVDCIDVGPAESDPFGPDTDDGRAVRAPVLPRRTTGTDAEQVNRVALLIDARRVPADTAAALLGQLAERGAVINVCRAYADWSRADLGDWVGRMRREGLHSFHHFSDDDDQALVAMAIDAVDIARDAAVDEVVIAGDLTSALPLVHRLHAAGVRVVAVGSEHTPHDVRAACHEFIDTASIEGDVEVPRGRHRA